MNCDFLAYELGIRLSVFQAYDIPRINYAEKETAALSVRKSGNAFQPTLCFLLLYRCLEIVGRAFYIQYFVKFHTS